MWLWCWRVPEGWTGPPPITFSERGRVTAVVTPLQRRQYAASIVFRRRVLGELLGLPPEQIVFRMDDHGKPGLQFSQNPHDWRFNLSHSADVVVLAAARGREIGVDIERLRPAVNWSGVAQTVFSRSERSALAQAADPLSSFYSLWTAKEAYLKACGVGLNAPLKDISLTVQRGRVEVQTRLPAAAREFCGWSLSPFTDCRAAVMVEHGPSAESRPALHVQVLNDLHSVQC